MNSFIKDNNLEDNVCFCDSFIDRANLNKGTSYAIYPLIMESFGLVLMESFIKASLRMRSIKNGGNSTNWWR